MAETPRHEPVPSQIAVVDSTATDLESTTSPIAGPSTLPESSSSSSTPSHTQFSEMPARHEKEGSSTSGNGVDLGRTETHQSALSEKFTELSRMVSVEAAAGPIALYAPRSRSGSQSSRMTSGRVGVSFPATVDEHERARGERTKPGRVGLARSSTRPDLPRIDSEKTLAPSDCEDDDGEVKEHPLRKLAKYKSRDSKDVSAPPSPTSETHEHTESVEEDVQVVMSRARKILLGFVIMLSVFISSMNSNAVILTIMSVSADLGVTEVEAQWISSAYSLAFGCGLLFSGRFADIYGRKHLFLGGLAVSIVFSILSGVIRSFPALCVMRALCGIGLSVAIPAAFGVVGTSFRHEPERTIAFSCFGLGNPLGASVGMLVGGGVASINAHGWQYLYFVLGGLTLIPFVLGFWVVPADAKKGKVDTRIDWLGGFIITAALCLFTFSITESGIASQGWKTSYVIALLVISVFLFGAFGAWERYVERHLSFPPLVKLSLFSRDGWKITIIMGCAFLPFVAIAGWVYLVSLFYQELKGMTPLGNAIHTLPASLCGILAALAVMWIVPRVRAPYVLMAGGFLSGLACLLFVVIPPDTTYWASGFLSMLLLPFGADLTVGIGSILMSNLCEDDEQSVGGALFQTATQIASALGICISSLVQVNVYNKTGDYHTGLQHAFGMTTAWAWAVVVIAAIFLRKMGLAKDVGNGRAIH